MKKWRMNPDSQFGPDQFVSDWLRAPVAQRLQCRCLFCARCASLFGRRWFWAGALTLGFKLYGIISLLYFDAFCNANYIKIHQITLNIFKLYTLNYYKLSQIDTNWFKLVQIWSDVYRSNFHKFQNCQTCSYFVHLLSFVYHFLQHRSALVRTCAMTQRLPLTRTIGIGQPTIGKRFLSSLNLSKALAIYIVSTSSAPVKQ